MKVLKRPKFKKITCPVCECVFLPHAEDIVTDRDQPYMYGGLFSRCPVCLTACETSIRTHRIAPVPADPVLTVPGDAAKNTERRCGTCKHTNQSFEQAPCCDCGEGHSEWEPVL